MKDGCPVGRLTFNERQSASETLRRRTGWHIKRGIYGAEKASCLALVSAKTSFLSRADKTSFKLQQTPMFSLQDPALGLFPHGEQQ